MSNEKVLQGSLEDVTETNLRHKLTEHDTASVKKQENQKKQDEDDCLKKNNDYDRACFPDLKCCLHSLWAHQL